MRSSNKMQITYFIFNILSLVIISFDSSSNALSKFFWAQLDRMKRSVAKSWKTRAHFQFSWISLSSRDQISYQTQIPCRAYQYRCLLTVRIKRPHRIGWKPIVPRASVNKKRKSPPRAGRSFFFFVWRFFFVDVSITWWPLMQTFDCVRVNRNWWESVSSWLSLSFQI